MSVYAFDGKKLGTARGLLGSSGSEETTVIKIPVGQHRLDCNFFVDSGKFYFFGLFWITTHYYTRAYGMSVSQDFQAGKTYRLKAIIHYLPGATKSGEKLYEYSTEDYDEHSLKRTIKRKKKIELLIEERGAA